MWLQSHVVTRSCGNKVMWFFKAMWLQSQTGGFSPSYPAFFSTCQAFPQMILAFFTV